MQRLAKPRNRARRVLTGLLVLSLALPVIVALDQSPAGSVPVECTPGVNCAPRAVTFYKQGANSYTSGFDGKFDSGFYGSGVRVCGLQDRFAPITAAYLDGTYDDPGKLGQTTEGNYRHSQSFSFQMGPKTTLASGDTITISLPRPVVDYKGGGADLPPRQLPLVTTPDAAANGTVTASALVTAGDAQSTTVKVVLPGVTEAKRVQLKVWDPYNPPSMGPGQLSYTNGYTIPSGYNLAVVANNPDTVVAGDPSLGVTTGIGGSSVENAASWKVTTSKAQSLVFSVDVLVPVANGVGNENPDYRILRTANVEFKGGTPDATKASSPCKNAPKSPSWLQGKNGPTYLVVIDDVGYIADARSTASGGAEFARVTVPALPKAVGPNKTVYVVALGAVSPPGKGTPQRPLSGNATPYPSSSFSISTSSSPLKGYPATPPVFQAALSPLAIHSKLSIESSEVQVGTEPNNSVTVTLRDRWNNPVPYDDIDLVATSARSTYSTAVPPTVNITPNSSGSSAYAQTNLDGEATFDLANSCAQTVRFFAIDVTTGIGPIGSVTVRPDGSLEEPKEVISKWTAGPSFAPDAFDPDFDPNCGVGLVRSSLTVTRSDGQVFKPDEVAYVNNPADGQSPATVTVTMGDEFGNPNACRPVELAPTSNVEGVTITPLVPPTGQASWQNDDGTVTSVKRSCPAGETAGYTNMAGVAKFAVTSSREQPVEVHVMGMSPVSLWPWGDDHRKDSARIWFIGPYWQTSTFVPERPTAVASGVVSNTLTVTLRNYDGLPLRGQKVAVSACKGTVPVWTAGSCTPSTTSVIQPLTPGVIETDQNGVVKFGIGNTVAETVSYQITNLTQPMRHVSGVTPTAKVTFTNSGFSFTAVPGEVIGDNVGITELRFIAKDSNGAPAPVPPPVLITPAGVTATLVSGPNPYTFSLKGNVTGPVEITAQLLYTTTPSLPCWGQPIPPNTCIAKLTTTVLFRPPPQQFLLSAAPNEVPADGATNSVVAVTALAADGSPAAGIPVRLSAVTGTPSIYPTLATTNGLGQAYFSVTHDVVEKVKLTARYLEIGTTTGPKTAKGCTATGACQVTVDFTPTEASQSYLTIDRTAISPLASPPPGACTPGANCAAVTVSLVDAAGKPINGNSVALFTGSATTTVRTSALNPGAISGKAGEAPGQVTFYVSDMYAEVLTIYARDLNTGVIIDHTQGPDPQPVTLTVA